MSITGKCALAWDLVPGALVKTRVLGRSGIEVSALGVGCMGLSEFYGPMAEGDRRATIHRALDAGITFFDTADMYGGGANEELLGRELGPVRASIVLATKCGIIRDQGGKRVDGTPAYVRRACEASLRRLRTECVDLFYLHRVDPATPIEDSVGAMADLVREGKTRAIGLSKLDAATLARADAVYPIAAVQAQYSLVARRVEAELIGACRRRGISLVAYSPLCKGLLTGRVPDVTRLAPDDWRRRDARFQGAALARNLAVIDGIRRHAQALGCSPAQLALAWLLSRGPDVVPIPGVRSQAQVVDNASAAEVVVPPPALEALEALYAEDDVSPVAASSERTADAQSVIA